MSTFPSRETITIKHGGTQYNICICISTPGDTDTEYWCSPELTIGRTIALAVEEHYKKIALTHASKWRSLYL